MLDLFAKIYQNIHEYKMNSFVELKSLRIRNQNNTIFLYLNFNSIKCKFEKLIVDENVDILGVTEPKVGKHFPTV